MLTVKRNGNNVVTNLHQGGRKYLTTVYDLAEREMSVQCEPFRYITDEELANVLALCRDHGLSDEMPTRDVVSVNAAYQGKRSEVTDSEMLNWLLGRLYLARPSLGQPGFDKDVWSIVSFDAPAWNIHAQGPHKMREVVAAAIRNSKGDK